MEIKTSNRDSTQHLFELLTKQNHLQLVVHGDNTSRSNTSQNVSTGTLEQGLNTTSSNDLGESIETVLVLDGLTRGHHHSSSDSVQWVSSSRSTSGNSPTKQEGSNEAALKRTNQNDRLKGVVETEVKTSVDNDTDDRWQETSVKTGDTVSSKSLSVNVNKTIELSLTTLRGLSVVCQSGSGVIQRVNEEQRSGTSKTTGSQVTSEPWPVTLLLLETKHLLELVLESKVQSLGWEVSDNVGGVTFPERRETLLSESSLETFTNTVVSLSESTLFDHLVLVLDQKFDSLDWGGTGLSDSGGDTSHHEVDEERGLVFRHLQLMIQLKSLKRKTVAKRIRSNLNTCRSLTSGSLVGNHTSDSLVEDSGWSSEVERSSGGVESSSLSQVIVVLQLVSEEFTRDVESLASHNNDLLAVEKFLGDGGCQSSQQMSFSVNHDNLLERAHLAFFKFSPLIFYLYFSSKEITPYTRAVTSFFRYLLPSFRYTHTPEPGLQWYSQKPCSWCLQAI
ncbi:hypothetical protein OGAPHI_005116 [Ogataea philodendri]|uniref:Uncharacterized protein n=1 Tax=Ogataea philodendri TaxID=1378263 RepID=A0A9P8P232_9ASCO|nr:uncharacterized protein OGAPHI_005116 [Ogataea philodendri]KAH3663715.1 hypothetical protein OGAPHI_005116 [Ogataea philodendri]